MRTVTFRALARPITRNPERTPTVVVPRTRAWSRT